MCSFDSRTDFEDSVSACEAQHRSHGFRKPPTRDVIEEIILQSRRDRGIVSPSGTYVDDDIADYLPALTGYPHVDNASRIYYNWNPTRNSLREAASPLSYVYPIHIILDVQHALREISLMVMPRPIPILILSSADYDGSSRFIQGEDGGAAIVPSKKTTWDAVRRCDVDEFFRPLFRDPVTGLPRGNPDGKRKPWCSNVHRPIDRH
ncbi:hypothetical protein M404DRAFT_774190 [Pisolithus tinctorius Marx 270]|uniref:Uncharacterized protein n=1 Tax=Pisolithus tinctorius Marx 270 TaxID=870435 RepID=A0A0C3J4M0_PISTI|nr:hypothetical protein M404DRAFT_774190 [Pisolithus tinctorius Marx 270]